MVRGAGYGEELPAGRSARSDVADAKPILPASVDGSRRGGCIRRTLSDEARLAVEGRSSRFILLGVGAAALSGDANHAEDPSTLWGSLGRVDADLTVQRHPEPRNSVIRHSFRRFNLKFRNGSLTKDLG